MSDAAEDLHPGRSKVEARRQQIVDAAAECARRSGFHGASMAEIAHTAGLSVGQIYRYFANKEAIVAAIVERDLAEMRDKFAEFETSDGGMVEAVIDRCGEAVERNYDLGRAGLMLEVMAEAARNPKVAAVVQAADTAERALGRQVLDAAAPAGRTEAETLARGEVLSMLFDGMALRAVNNPNVDHAEIARVLQAVMRFLLTGGPLEAAAVAGAGSGSPAL
ncbi:TetR/AcrR family transcriptional regulator [Caulobacter sp. KR2-114]|uniref:TetR/AcrR family transcriptional regulator n=1 Tax=Caulobacter sp. KR2-114 TaxID=3400912 RepID=UPI003BFF9831